MNIPQKIVESLQYIIQSKPDSLTQNVIDELDELSVNKTVLYENIKSADRSSKIVDLSNNNLYKLPAPLFEYKELVILKLSNNNIIDFEGIENFENLKYLIIDQNYLKLLPHEIFELKNLVYLDARFNELHYLTKKISKLESLLYLNLDQNLISFVPNEIKNCKSLRHFNMARNRLSSFTSVMLRSKNLIELHLWGNPNLNIDPESVQGNGIIKINLDEPKKQNSNVPRKRSKLKNLFQDYIDLFSGYLRRKTGQKVKINVEEDDSGYKLTTQSEENIPFEQLEIHLKEYLEEFNNSSEKIQELKENNQLIKYELYEMRQTVREINSEKEYLAEKANRYYEKVLFLKSTVEQQNKFIDSLKTQVDFLANNNLKELNNSAENQKQVIVNIENKQINNTTESKQITKEELKFDFDADELLLELYKKAIRLTERKHTHKLESLNNDSITDFLRDKGYNVADQTRSGISKKDAGSVDIMIRDNDGTPLSIIEAMRLSSCGPRNKTVLEHYNRMLAQYDTAGQPVMFMVVYSEAKDFSKIWENYSDYVEGMNNTNFDIKLKYPILSFNDTYISKVSDIKIGLSKHIREGKLIKVYHLFVNMFVQEPGIEKFEKIYL